ncbi:MAG: serine/threonine-protein kinase [Planctomycetota bacterium]|nr:serine/threonine-protein kinase [Planctomycetota bacterium]
MSDLTGKTIAGYPLVKLLSQGGYDEVYQVTTSGAPLAVRLLHAYLRQDQALSAAVVRGWEAARAVSHPNLVTVFSTGIEPGIGAYSLEEMPPGKPVRQMVLGGGKFAWRDCLVLVEQLCAALKALHAVRLCHGALWPGCVLMTQDQDMKLEGAGGVSLTDGWLTDLVTGPAVGYLAPEIIEGSPVSPESDFYGAGACLYFLIAGQDAFPGEDSTTIATGVLERKAPPLSALRDDVTPEAEQFVARLMARNPTERYGSLDDVLADIARLKSGQSLAPLKGGRAAAPPRPRPKAAPAPAAPAAPSAPPAKPAGKTTGFLAAIKGPGTRTVFGRLETHVKSTIPQSDTEKHGDDLYRQGQLPLAVAAWRDAYLNATPHAALKVKIELGEQDLKRETYTMALEEARYRLSSGNFKGAISRAREAMAAAGNDKQRQDAVALEGEALDREEKALKARKIKLVAAGLVFVAVLVLLVRVLSKPPVDESPALPGNGEPEKSDTVKKGTDDKRQVPKLTSGIASVTLPAPWTLNGNEGRVVLQGATDPVATLRITQCPPATVMAEKLKELRGAGGLKDVRDLGDLPNVSGFIDGEYQSVELGIQYTDGGQTRLRYYYLIDGPGNVVFQAEFDGRDDPVALDLRTQARAIMQVWTFRK